MARDARQVGNDGVQGAVLCDREGAGSGNVSRFLPCKGVRVCLFAVCLAKRMRVMPIKQMALVSANICLNAYCQIQATTFASKICSFGNMRLRLSSYFILLLYRIIRLSQCNERAPRDHEEREVRPGYLNAPAALSSCFPRLSSLQTFICTAASCCVILRILLPFHRRRCPLPASILHAGVMRAGQLENFPYL
jgi:hypothetical protein